jgi:hydrogenase maturation factor
MSALSLGNAYTLAEQKKLGDTVGGWLRTQDSAGHVVLAGQEVLRDPDPLLNGRSVLYVNEAFLADQPVRLASGGNYRVGDGLDVIVPSSLRGHADVVTPSLETLLRQQTKFRAVEAADGQSFFTYAVPSSAGRPAGLPVLDQANVTDPLIVVLPSAKGLLSNDSYTAFASSAMVLFPRPAVVKDAVASDQALQTYVRAVVPLSEQAAVEQQTVARELRLALLTALIGMLVLVITGIGVVLIHSRRNAQLIFARHVNGWSFPAVHRSLFAVEAVVLAVVIGVVPFQVWKQNQELAVYQLTAGPTFSLTAAVALLVALMVCGMLAALAHMHRQVVRDIGR